MSNSLPFLRRVMSTLAASGLEALAFGGWAEELLQISPPRSHGDIDLLVIADAGDVDIALRGRDEVTAKRFSHKRAFIEGGTLVKLFLVQRFGATETTTFWNAFTWTWPALSPLMVEGLAVAPPTALHAYRRHHADIASHRGAADLSPVPIESCGLQPGDI